MNSNIEVKGINTLTMLISTRGESHVNYIRWLANVKLTMFLNSNFNLYSQNQNMFSLILECLHFNHFKLE